MLRRYDGDNPSGCVRCVRMSARVTAPNYLLGIINKYANANARAVPMRTVATSRMRNESGERFSPQGSYPAILFKDIYIRKSFTRNILTVGDNITPNVKSILTFSEITHRSKSASNGSRRGTPCALHLSDR